MKGFSYGGGGLYLVYSKTSDNLPIVTTSVESGVPCIYPADLSQPSYGLYYPLERDRHKEDCRFADHLGIANDDRF